MKDKKKVMAAVMAGVDSYLESQEKDAALSTLKRRRSAFTLNLWGVDGRQEIMQAKRMWQMRWFRK
jgi:hypothetical protein